MDLIDINAARLEVMHIAAPVGLGAQTDLAPLVLFADCARITAPLLAIQGVEDPYGTMRQIEEIDRFDGNLGQITHEIGLKPPWNMRNQLYKLERFGHSPHRDQVELTTAAITQFLQAGD